MSFKVKDHSWSSRDNPHFDKPRVRGYYSINQSGEFSQDSSQLKYFKPPKDRFVSMNLNEGYEQVRRMPKDRKSAKLDNILRWILHNSEGIKEHRNEKRWLEPEFICSRGRLTALMRTPYESQSWITCAAKWKGTIYLCEFETEQLQWREANMSDELLRCSSWGHKFEQYILSDTPDQYSDTSQPVNEGDEFYCVFTSRLGRHNLLYGAEVDGVCSKEIFKDPLPLDKLELVELATNRLIKFRKQRYNFNRYKTVKWWCQSYLAGIQNILCGLRDDEGFVKELRTYAVSDLPAIGKEYWHPLGCMQFCDAFLNHLKNVVVKDYDECLYKFEFTPNGDIEMTEMREPNEYSFLPQWYIDGTRDLDNL